jgi:hypothetical protein
MLTLFMGMAAFSVDVGHWYYVRNREQKAADAAALAAAIHWPGDKSTGIAEAIEVAERNGFTASEVTVTDDGGARVRVTIQRDVKNFFGNFLGVDTTRISRSAVGEFQSSIPLGSPTNGYGNEALQTDPPPEARWSTDPSATQPQFWGNIFGPRSVKQNGDAHQAKVCGSAMFCNSPDTNLDYKTDGYLYVVRVGAQPAGTNRLAFEVFDPAFVNVGDTCTESTMTPAPPASEDPGGNPFRYASGAASPFCSGDQLFTGNGQDGIPPTTTYMLRAPDDTPWDHADNPLITSGNCNSNNRQFPGYNDSIASLLATNPTEGFVTSSPGGNAVQFKDHFRKWFRICQINANQVVPGDYVIQIRTNLTLGNPATAPAPLNQGSGANRFALRAAWINNATGAPNGTGVSLFAADAMSLFANASGADTRFYLARILPGSAGRTLHLRWFDTGDASDPGDLQVLPPNAISGDPGGTFNGCTVQRPSGTAAVAAASDCRILGLTNSTDNGDWIDVFIPIPTNYTCASASSFGCWLKLKFTYPSGTTVYDTTTWTASLEGDPVRLVE